MVSTRQQCSGTSNNSGNNVSSEIPSTSSSIDNHNNVSNKTLVARHKNATALSQVHGSSSRNMKVSPSLMDFPNEILDKIISGFSYKTVGNLRMVCKRFDKICGARLNMTFIKLQNEMLIRFQDIKSKMPRRESARRQHPLACESDIIETLHMRLSLLQMSFGKHIERKHCCFFAGEILDEVHRILHYIKVTPKLARPYKVTDELFDLTSMAMEYFKEKIEPYLPEITYFRSDLLDFSPLSGDRSDLAFSDSMVSLDYRDCVKYESGNMQKSPLAILDKIPVKPPQSNMVLRKRIRKITRGMKRYNSQLTSMKQDLKNYKSKMAEQQKTIVDYSIRLDENDKKNEEMSKKFSTLLQELNKCKTELQYWRSKSPLTNLCVSCGHPVPALPSEDLEALSNQGVVISFDIDGNPEPTKEVCDVDVINTDVNDSNEMMETESLKNEPTYSKRVVITATTKEPAENEERAKSSDKTNNEVGKEPTEIEGISKRVASGSKDTVTDEIDAISSKRVGTLCKRKATDSQAGAKKPRPGINLRSKCLKS